MFKTQVVGLDEADFVSGVRELGPDDVEDTRHRNAFQRAWRYVERAAFTLIAAAMCSERLLWARGRCAMCREGLQSMRAHA